MKNNFFFRLISFLFFSIVLCGCNQVDVSSQKTVTKKNSFDKNRDSLSSALKDGDLLVRLTDDLVSEQVKLLNEKDKRYSHAGLVFMERGQWVVYNISPDDKMYDTIKALPLDTFINPNTNLSCALYRYDYLPGEPDSLKKDLKSLQKSKITFDWHYDLSTDSAMYCAELIDKALQSATHGRLEIRKTYLPKKMLPLVYRFFRNEKVPDSVIASRKIITIDNLYLRPDCRFIMAFDLKQFPGR